MNLDQLINMGIRMITRRLMRRGINVGMDAASRRMSKGKAADPNTPEARRQAAQARDLAKRSRQAMRLTRRM